MARENFPAQVANRRGRRWSWGLARGRLWRAVFVFLLANLMCLGVVCIMVVILLIHPV